MFNLSTTLASDDELADLCADKDEALDRRLKDELGLAASEPLMLVLYCPDDGLPDEVAVWIAKRLGRPVVVIDVDDREVLAFARPPMLVMQTEILLDPDNVAAATAALTAQGFTVEVLDRVVEVEGVVLSPPAKLIRVCRWSDAGALLGLMVDIVGPSGGDVSDSTSDRRRLH